jgi:hypothetical protein
MGFNTYERKLTDEFFNSLIGKVVKDAIYNNMTIVCHDIICCLTGGEYNSNDITVIYEPDNDKPIVRTSNIWYRDTLLVENPEHHFRSVRVNASYNTTNGKFIEYGVSGIDGGEPFNLIWTTTIMVNNEPVNTYTSKIKVIPKTISKEE